MGLLENFLELIKFGGLPVLFLLVIIEGNPIIGSFVPGQILVIFIGFLISTSGIFGLKTTILVVFFAALIGDLIGYFMGRRLGFKGLKKFGISKNSKIYSSSKSFFEKYGAWSIVLGRQFNLTRAFMPFFAGSFGMRFIPFLLVSIFSCILWSVLSVLLGYYFGYVIVNNFKMFMWFVFYLITYLILVYAAYKSLIGFYESNKSFLRRHAIHTFFSLGFLVSIFILMLFIIKWDYYILFNESFAFIYFTSFYKFFEFFTSSYFLGIYFFFLLLLFVFSKRFKIAIVYLWSVLFLFFFSVIIFLFLRVFFDFVPYFSVMLFTFFIFYTWVYIQLFYRGTKKYFYLNGLLVLLLMIVFLSKFSFTSNLYLTLFSFLLGVIISDLIWLFSYYHILDRCLYDSRDLECRIR